jgi:hypothetical protein
MEVAAHGQPPNGAGWRTALDSWKDQARPAVAPAGDRSSVSGRWLLGRWVREPVGVARPGITRFGRSGMTLSVWRAMGQSQQQETSN